MLPFSLMFCPLTLPPTWFLLNLAEGCKQTVKFARFLEISVRNHKNVMTFSKWNFETVKTFQNFWLQSFMVILFHFNDYKYISMIFSGCCFEFAAKSDTKKIFHRCLFDLHVENKLSRFMLFMLSETLIVAAEKKKKKSNMTLTVTVWLRSVSCQSGTFVWQDRSGRGEPRKAARSSSRGREESSRCRLIRGDSSSRASRAPLPQLSKGSLTHQRSDSFWNNEAKKKKTVSEKILIRRLPPLHRPPASTII